MSTVIERDHLPDPHGWIQWKGTDVCMDLHCVCGHHGHVDGEFFYYYRCSSCQRVYAVGASVRLWELDADAQQAEQVDPEQIQTDTLF